MHRTQAPQNLANKYSDVLPGTIIAATDMNALQEEIAGAVEWSGQTLAVSGATDEAALWKQLRDAIAELSAASTPKPITLRFQSGNVADHVDIACTYMRHSLRRLVTLFIPGVSIAIAPDSNFVSILGAAGAAFPADLRPAAAVQFVIPFDDDNFLVSSGGGVCTMAYDTGSPSWALHIPRSYDLGPVFSAGPDFSSGFNLRNVTVTYFV